MREVDIECTDRWGRTDGHGMGVCLTVGTGHDPHGMPAGYLQLDERGGSSLELHPLPAYLDEAALTALVVAAATALAELQALRVDDDWAEAHERAYPDEDPLTAR